MSNTVHYFGIFGRGDFVAIQFIDAGIEFSWKIHEAPLPAEDKKELYFGQLPCFEDEHVGKLVQSQAIIHYVSSKTGFIFFFLYPSFLSYLLFYFTFITSLVSYLYLLFY